MFILEKQKISQFLLHSPADLQAEVSLLSHNTYLPSKTRDRSASSVPLPGDAACSFKWRFYPNCQQLAILTGFLKQDTLKQILCVPGGKKKKKKSSKLFKPLKSGPLRLKAQRQFDLENVCKKLPANSLSLWKQFTLKVYYQIHQFKV